MCLLGGKREPSRALSWCPGRFFASHRVALCEAAVPGSGSRRTGLCAAALFFAGCPERLLCALGMPACSGVSKDGAGPGTQWCRSVWSMVPVSGVSGAGPYPPAVANSLSLNDFLDNPRRQMERGFKRRDCKEMASGRVLAAIAAAKTAKSGLYLAAIAPSPHHNALFLQSRQIRASVKGRGRGGRGRRV